MRLVLAIISFALAALMIGFGIAQRTILVGPDHVTAAVSTTGDAPVSVIDGSVLNSFDRKQTLEITGADSNYAAYGRTTDVLAWVGDTSYNEIGFDAETGKLTSTLVEGTDETVPDPSGSDLWVADFREDSRLGFTVDVPEDISVIVVADGALPAPSDLSVTWALDNSTPWAFPLLIAGAVFLLIGLIFLLLALNHVRKARGPRRKQTKLPRVPRPPAYKAITSPKSGSAIAGPKGRRAISRSVAIVPTVLVGVLLLGGCADAEPSTVDPSSTALATDSQGATDEQTAEVVDEQIPAVTIPQAKRIVARIAATVAEADAAGDATILAARMDGPALALRTANYAIRKVDAATVAPAAIPAEPVRIVLPQQNNEWPRTVFVVLQDEADATIAPTALMLIQQDARSQYKVHYALQLEPGAIIPDVAAANVGTQRLDSDAKLLSVAPEDIGVFYSDVLMNDAASPYIDQFDAKSDLLRTQVGLAVKQARIAGVPSTASLTFATTPGTGPVVALATNDGGALVALSLAESETIAPIEAGAAVNAPAQVAALLGKALSTKGITAVYGDQVLFYVPAVGDNGPIILLGYSQGLITAAELP